jgi:hypothetical protein
VNDVASINIDAKLVRNDRNRDRAAGGGTNSTADLADTIELANGCACERGRRGGRGAAGAFLVSFSGRGRGCLGRLDCQALRSRPRPGLRPRPLLSPPPPAAPPPGCNLQDELFASFEQVLALADKRGEPYARIVLENSGVAEPHVRRGGPRRGRHPRGRRGAQGQLAAPGGRAPPPEAAPAGSSSACACTHCTPSYPPPSPAVHPRQLCRGRGGGAPPDGARLPGHPGDAGGLVHLHPGLREQVGPGWGWGLGELRWFHPAAPAVLRLWAANGRRAAGGLLRVRGLLPDARAAARAPPRLPVASRPELGDGGNMRPVVDLLVEQVGGGERGGAWEAARGSGGRGRKTGTAASVGFLPLSHPTPLKLTCKTHDPPPPHTQRLSAPTLCSSTRPTSRRAAPTATASRSWGRSWRRSTPWRRSWRASTARCEPRLGARRPRPILAPAAPPASRLRRALSTSNPGVSTLPVRARPLRPPAPQRSTWSECLAAACTASWRTSTQRASTAAPSPRRAPPPRTSRAAPAATATAARRAAAGTTTRTARRAAARARPRRRPRRARRMARTGTSAARRAARAATATAMATARTSATATATAPTTTAATATATATATGTGTGTATSTRSAPRRAPRSDLASAALSTTGGAPSTRSGARPAGRGSAGGRRAPGRPSGAGRGST